MVSPASSRPLPLTFGPERGGLRDEVRPDLRASPPRAFADALEDAGRRAIRLILAGDGQVQPPVGRRAKPREPMQAAVENTTTGKRLGLRIESPLAALADHEIRIRWADRAAAGAVVRRAKEFFDRLARGHIPDTDAFGVAVSLGDP